MSMTEQGNTRSAVIYARVSLDRDGTSTSVDRQIADLRAKAADRGWTVREVVRDDGIGASRFTRKTRPGFASLTDILRADDVLMVYEVSRISRQVPEVLALKTLCIDRGAGFFDGHNLVDFSDPSSEFMLTMNAANAELETARMSKRITDGKRAKAMTGVPQSHPGFGWTAAGFDVRGKTVYELDPVAAPLIAEAVAGVIAGTMTAYRVARQWNSMGLRTHKVTGRGGAWSSDSVKRVLLRPTNAGLAVYRGEILTVRSTLPTIITETDYERLKARYAADARQQTHAGTKPTSLLSGIAVCGECRKPLRTDNSRTSPRLKCRNEQCGRVTRVAAPIEKMVDAVVIEVIEQFRMRLWLDEDPAVHEAHAHLLRANAIEAEMNAYVEAFGAGELPISLDQFRRGTTGFSERIAAERSQAATVNDDAALRAILEHPAEETWNADRDLDIRRGIVRALLDVVVFSAKSGNLASVTAKPNLVRNRHVT